MRKLVAAALLFIPTLASAIDVKKNILNSFPDPNMGTVYKINSNNNSAEMNSQFNRKEYERVKLYSFNDTNSRLAYTIPFKKGEIEPLDSFDYKKNRIHAFTIIALGKSDVEMVIDIPDKYCDLFPKMDYKYNRISFNLKYHLQTRWHCNKLHGREVSTFNFSGQENYQNLPKEIREKYPTFQEFLLSLGPILTVRTDAHTTYFDITGIKEAWKDLDRVRNKKFEKSE